ncbi:hypothetical protein OH491_24925 [Termitidicoccus mucosus]|uniref:hypothetical protein n=1 Tax=Termitidicoccus mucosus TaxID=1184151 RepID=UPI0011AB6A8B
MNPAPKAIIPPTTPETYLTGQIALNIPAPEGTCGDWHAEAIFDNPNANIARHRAGGAGMFYNTNPLLRNLGIHECSQWFIQKHHPVPGPVYAANHYRAILDMVINAWAKNRVPAPMSFFDYISESRHQMEFLKILREIPKKVSPRTPGCVRLLAADGTPHRIQTLARIIKANRLPITQP